MADANRKARERFGANVDRLRREKGLSLDALAARAELERRAVEGIVSGEIEARASTIYPLAGALGVEPGALFSGIEWVPADHGGGKYRIEDPDR